jgi:hypothetical protein
VFLRTKSDAVVLLTFGALNVIGFRFRLAVPHCHMNAVEDETLQIIENFPVV